MFVSISSSFHSFRRKRCADETQLELTPKQLKALEDATESKTRKSRLACATKKHIARQDVWLEREIEHARSVEAESWRRIYKSMEAVEEARVRLRRAEEDRVKAEQERRKAEESRGNAEARFAKIEAERERLGLQP
jgi:hypothetical protein